MVAEILGVLQEILLPLLAAAGLGALVGWEHETWNKPAGLRRHTMVAVGAASFTLVALQLVEEAAHAGNTALDPIRIVEGIVSGIGFLGAGSIIQSGGSVRGITTAAGIWVVGALGAACGARDYVLAALTALFALGILAVMAKFEIRAQKNAEE